MYVTCSGQACEVNGEADVCKIGEEVCDGGY